MKSLSLIPDSYLVWRHCIEVVCKQPISRAYVLERIVELESIDAFKTRQFVEFYGDEHRQKVIAWFKQAGYELEASSP